jgi:regulatory protein
MKITAISAQRQKSERVNLHVDGAFRLALAQEVVVRAGLRVGDLVTESQLAGLEREDLRWRARDAALNLLSFRARSAAELRRRLLRKEFPSEVADECIASLQEAGLLDDAAFAASFVRDRMRFRPRGRMRLAQELRARGVDADTAHAAIGEAMEGEDVSELELAREVAARWSPRAGEDPLRARRRLYGLLARRGFGGETVRRIMEEREI